MNGHEGRGLQASFTIDVSVRKYIEQIKSQEPRFAKDENKQKDLLSLMGLKEPELLSKR